MFIYQSETVYQHQSLLSVFLWEADLEMFSHFSFNSIMYSMIQKWEYISTTGILKYTIK